MDSDRISQAVRAFEESADVHSVISNFVKIIAHYGFVGFTAGDFDVQERSKLLLYTSMAPFFGILDEENPWWSDDPVVAELGNGQMHPFRVEDAWASPLPTAAPRWEQIVSAGLGRGWVFPTSKPGFIGGVHLISQVDEAVIERQNRFLSELHILSTYFHAFVTERDPEPDSAGIVRNTLGLRPFDGRKAKLTQREVDSLRWAAFGKTAEEIAIIEGLSVHTIRDYQKSAMLKLDSRNQAQAVARGLKYGLFKI